MRDVAGKKLNVGDIVVTMFDGYSSLTICEVVKITNKKVAVKLRDRTTATPITQMIGQFQETRYKFPDQVARIEYEV